jgi:hypothetical protein
MTYAELVAEIKLLSRRGDIDDKIAIALRMTTLRAHRLDFFWRDLVEANLTFANSSVVTVDVSTALTRFRQVGYLQYMDAATGALGSMLDEIEPSAIIDEYGYQKSDRWYLAGTNLNINFRYPATAARIGYWQNPDVAVTTYNSWIATELPDLLVQGALAYIYNMTGKQEEARALNRMVGFEPDPNNRAPGMTLVDQLKAANIRGGGTA